MFPWNLGDSVISQTLTLRMTVWMLFAKKGCLLIKVDYFCGKFKTNELDRYSSDRECL